jgi:hypothetical protein
LDGVKRAASNMLNFVIDANSGNGNGDGSWQVIFQNFQR